MLWIAAAMGCGGSAIDGVSVHGGPPPWIIGGEALSPAEVPEARSPADSPSREADAEGPREPSVDTGSASSLDAVEPPDGFPGPVETDCPAGTLCGLQKPEPCVEGRCNSLGDCIATPILGCCASDVDCSGMVPGNACEVFRCDQASCTPVNRPGCCSTTDDCDDDVTCTTDLCLGGPGGQCSHCPVGCDCPDTAPLQVVHFDGPTLLSDGFGINDQQFDSVSWRLSSRRAISPPTSAWLGHSDCPTYFSGTLGFDCQPSAEGSLNSGPVTVELVGPGITLPESPGGVIASFWLWSDVEVLASGGADERDVLTVMVHDLLTDVTWPVTSSLAVGKSTGGAWQQMALDLSPWRGSTVSLRFLFDTLDSQDNHHEGIYLDDLRITPRCASGCCDVDADCPQDSSADVCLLRRCVTLADGSGGTCLDVPSLPGEGCVACADDAACVDDNPCTEDVCDPGGVCQHVSFCCLEVSTYAAGFEDGLAAWYVSDEQPQDTVTWTTSEDSASEGSWAAWLGDPLTGTYATGGAVKATLQSAQVALPEGTQEDGEAAVRFALSLSTEWDGFPYDNPSGIDRLSLELVASGQDVVEIWSSDAVSGSTNGTWLEVMVPLEPWAGQSVQFRFVFDSGDGDRNDYAGPRIDDLRVGQVCP
jgi:hypothetical protein